MEISCYLGQILRHPFSEQILSSCAIMQLSHCQMHCFSRVAQAKTVTCGELNKE